VTLLLVANLPVPWRHLRPHWSVRFAEPRQKSMASTSVSRSLGEAV